MDDHEYWRDLIEHRKKWTLRRVAAIEVAMRAIAEVDSTYNDWSCRLCTGGVMLGFHESGYPNKTRHDPDCLIVKLNEARRGLSELAERQRASMEQFEEENGYKAAPPKPTLYRMFDAAGNLLYIGRTVRPMTSRMHEHHKNKDWARLVVDIKGEHFESEEELAEAERQAIRVERPRFNKQHNSK